MKAAWDWHLPVATREDQEAVANFAAELGFDTLIAPNPSEEMVDRGRALGLKVIAIVYGRPSDTFAEKHPECLDQAVIHLAHTFQISNPFRERNRQAVSGHLEIAQGPIPDRQDHPG